MAFTKDLKIIAEHIAAHHDGAVRRARYEASGALESLAQSIALEFGKAEPKTAERFLKTCGIPAYKE